MKIELHDLSELFELADLVNDARRFRAEQDAAWAPRTGPKVIADCMAAMAEMEANRTPRRGPEPEPRDVSGGLVAPEPPVEDPAVVAEAAARREASIAAAPELDADGRRWDERIDSSNKGLNKDGTWRARRNHGLSDEEVAKIKADGIAAGKVAQPEPAQPEPEPETDDTPAVTETHPLPVDADEEPEARDYSDLILKASELAGDQKDGLLDVLNAAKEFVKAHSPMAWTEFSQAVVPGKSVQGYEPAERRLILAAIEVYNAEDA